MTSKRYRGLAMLGVLAIAATACGGSTASGTPAASAPASAGTSAAPASQAPAAGGDFTFVVDSEPTTLAGYPDDLPTSWITGFIYTTLYQPNYKVEYVPLAADGPPVTSADGLTWTVKIKPNIKFHDGSRLDRRRRQVHVRPARPPRTAASTRMAARRSRTTSPRRPSRIR